MCWFVCHPFSALFYCLYVCVLYAFVPYLVNQHTDNLFSLRAASIDRLMLYTWPAVYKKKSVTMHNPAVSTNPNPKPQPNPNLGLVHHASFVYTYGRPCV